MGQSLVSKNGGAPAVENKRTYDVTVEREGRWWVFEIPELDTAGQARNLAEVSDEARGIISAWEHVDIDSIDVSVTVTSAEDAQAEWQKAEAELAAAQARVGERKRSIVVTLRSKGLTADDTGRVLGISKQRVFQIEKDKSDAS
ncbi:antitoxin HicB [Curtobacterium sp. MCPF17_047]|nr:antitoxin HicB [Curtobacterium sp. MCPF17_001]PZF69229.1 antitoxin HicB [Curtobacterium sp. MCPF17_047]